MMRNWEVLVICLLGCFSLKDSYHSLQSTLSSAQFSRSVVSDSLRPHGLQHARLHHQLPEFTQTHVHWIGDAIQPSHPHYPLLPPSIFPSIRVFSNESGLDMRWRKYWSFSFNISPSSSEHWGLISFRMDWLDLLAVQGTLKSLLQHHSSKASILGAQPSSQSISHIHTWLLEKP